MKSLFSILGVFVLAAVTLAGPYYQVNLDFQDPPDTFLIYARQCDSITLRAYTYMNGDRLTLSNGSWGAVAGYGTNDQFSTTMVMTNGTVNTNSNFTEFLFDAASLNTNGQFFFQVSFTNATQRYSFAGSIIISRNPIGGGATPLLLTGVVNGDTITWTGRKPWTNDLVGAYMPIAGGTFTGPVNFGNETVTMTGLVGNASSLLSVNFGSGDIRWDNLTVANFQNRTLNQCWEAEELTNTLGGVMVNLYSDDETLAGNSPNTLVSERAIKAAITNAGLPLAGVSLGLPGGYFLITNSIQLVYITKPGGVVNVIDADITSP